MVSCLSERFFILYMCYVCSYTLITQNKRFTERANICQRKSEFYTQISILLKPSCTPKKLCYRYIVIMCMYINLYVKNVSTICQYVAILFNFR